MNTFARFPSHLHWNAQQLTDAVPVRLHALRITGILGDGALPAAANRLARRPRAAASHAARSTLPALFRIR